MRYWDLLKDLSDSDKFELGLMLMESVKSSFSAPKNDEDWWVKEMWKEPVKPYTMDEINAIIDRSEADIAAGRGIPDEEVWRRFNEELALEEEEYELTEAV